MLPAFVLRGIELGYIPAERAIHWADQMIVATDTPEPWLIELATIAPARVYDILRVLQEHGGTTEVDDDTFMAFLAYGFSHGKLGVEDVRSELMQRMCLPYTGDMTALRQEIYYLDDEARWDAGRARARCEAILRPFTAEGERLVKSGSHDT